MIQMLGGEVAWLQSGFCGGGEVEEFWGFVWEVSRKAFVCVLGVDCSLRSGLGGMGFFGKRRSAHGGVRGGWAERREG